MNLNPNIIVVTDSMSLKRSYDLEHNDSEGYTKETVEEILEALGCFSSQVLHYDELDDFIKATERKDDLVVIPAYFGVASPNSKAIVPSICEARNICYVGADAYTQALCNDKYLSKLYARDMGLKSGKGFLVRNSEECNFEKPMRYLKYPVIVKPNYGGGSNGISQKSLCFCIEEVCNRATKLLSSQNVPILVEEYLSGYEVQVIFARMADGSIMSGQLGMKLDENDFFTDSVFGLETKKLHEHCMSFSPVKVVSNESMTLLKSIFRSFPKAEMMRIDCRVDKSGTPFLIEFSPDCSLRSKAGLSRMFQSHGFSYSQMFQQLIKAALRSY